MLKVLIWRVSDDTRFQDKALKILESQHNGIELIGVTANTKTSLVYEGRNVNFIPLAEVDGGDYEILVVGAKKIGMSKVIKNFARFSLPEEKLLGDSIVCIPGFTLEKYRLLQRLRLSIISRQCFGGCISNMLGLPFRSPFVNLFIRYGDFIKFLRSPKTYMETEVRFLKYSDTSRGYPILSLGDITLNMLHYKTAEEAIAKWNERKTRIDPNNLFIITAFNDKKCLQEFDVLPYDKKVCFVPFKSDLDSAWYIKPGVDSQAKDFIDSVNRFGWGYVIYYDLFDMLLYGKKTPLIDM